MKIKIATFVAPAVLGVCGIAAVSAEAAENGNTPYSPGSAQFYAGAIPPSPGIYALSQTSYYSADRLVDGNGDDLPFHFSVKAPVQTFRILGVSDVHVGGGTLWGQVVLPVLLDMKIEAGGAEGSRSGLADPLIGGGIFWHDGPYHTVFGVDVGVPIGSYDKNRLANNGNNHWSIQPTLGFEYVDYSNPAWEVGISLRYIHNFENKDTDYRSGNQAILDYAVGHHFGKMRLGVAGYYQMQLTDDKGPGVGADGNRTRGFAIGPSFSWAVSQATRVDVTYQKETWAENRAKGENVIVGVTMAF